MIASVVMPTFNKKERLGLALESFKYQTVNRDDFEVIVVDDGSTDETEVLFRTLDYAFNVRYLRKQNEGRSVARNTGIRAAKGEIVIFCDDDLIVGPKFIEMHIKAHNGREDGVVHGLIYNLPYLKFFKNPETAETYEAISEEQLEMLKTFIIKRERIGYIEEIHAQSKMTLLEKVIKSIATHDIHELKWLYFTGGNVSCKKSLMEEVALFDSSFGKEWGSEDFELGYRLYLKGANFIYAPEAYNYHMMHVRTTFKSELEVSINRFYELHHNPYIYHLAKLLKGEIKDVRSYVKYVEENKING